MKNCNDHASCRGRNRTSRGHKSGRRCGRYREAPASAYLREELSSGSHSDIEFSFTSGRSSAPRMTVEDDLSLGNEICPLCKNHCPLMAPGCPRGEAYAAGKSN